MLPFIWIRSLPTIKPCNSPLGNGGHPGSTPKCAELSPLVSGCPCRDGAHDSVTHPDL